MAFLTELDGIPLLAWIRAQAYNYVALQEYVLMEHNEGWGANEVVLTSREVDGHNAQLTLSCRWIEYLQPWNGDIAPFFLIHVNHTSRLAEADWQLLGFKDRSGKDHSYITRDVREVRTNVIRMTKVR
jgi:hypothetical protein